MLINSLEIVINFPRLIIIHFLLNPQNIHWWLGGLCGGGYKMMIA
jgi:hypothetical protein